MGYGLAVAGLPLLPALQSDGSPSDPRASLRWEALRAPVPPSPPSWFREEDDSLIVGWGGYAEYRVDAGEGRVRATLDGVDLEEGVLAFLISVLPLALPLFGLEPLHGSALAVEGAAVVVLGRSGSGKSSMAERLAARGCRFLADDAAAIDADGLLWPGPPVLASRGDHPHVPVVGEYSGKRVLPIASRSMDPLPVRGVAVLAPEAGRSLIARRLDPSEAVRALLTHARAPMVLRERRRAAQLGVASALSAVPVDEVSYSPGHDSPDDVAGEILGLHRRP